MDTCAWRARHWCVFDACRHKTATLAPLARTTRVPLSHVTPSRSRRRSTPRPCLPFPRALAPGDGQGAVCARPAGGEKASGDCCPCRPAPALVAPPRVAPPPPLPVAHRRGPVRTAPLRRGTAVVTAVQLTTLCRGPPCAGTLAAPQLQALDPAVQAPPGGGPTNNLRAYGADHPLWAVSCHLGCHFCPGRRRWG